jgi:hypothetical protein
LEQPSVLGQAVPLFFQYQCFFNLKTLNVMKKLYTALVLLMVSVSFVNAQPAFEQRSLEEALNPDGTLKRGAQGSFKVEGYTMRTGKNGEPIFEPQTQHTASGTWSTLGTGSQNGVLGFVFALAVVGNEVYVGGEFDSAGGVSARNVARFNTQTNTWSSLGTGSSNGVDSVVLALAVVGNEVVVGGVFTSAGGVSANGVARFNTQTNTWSTLGTGSSNGVSIGGVSGNVTALAVSGNEVYVGGEFTLAGGIASTFIARWIGGATNVEPISIDMPSTYLLQQNYPNPFNPSTTILFSIPTSEFVTLKVYDLLGREIATLVNENLSAGSYSYNFDAKNLTSGVYLYKLQAGKYSETKKMLLSK